MRSLLFLLAVVASGFAGAQEQRQPARLSYSYAELRFVDVDENDGDGFEFNGSFELGSNWIVLGGVTLLDFDSNVDSTTFEIGGGYVYPYRSNFDLLGTVRFIRTDVESPFGDFDDSGVAVSAGVRGMFAPNFEVRGLVNHVNLDDSDTFLEFAVDYHFTNRVAAGLSVDVGGDSDVWSVGGRWFFR